MRKPDPATRGGNLEPSRLTVTLGLLIMLAGLFKTLPYLLPRLGWSVPEAEVASYLWNFSPLLPLAVVMGASLSLRGAVLCGSLAWLLGDLGIWAASGRWDLAFYRGQPIVYLCLWLVVATGFLGSRLQRSDSLASRIPGNLLGGMVGAAVFFLVSNLLVWLLGNEVQYPHTLGGQLECYTMAIPFHKNDFFSMLLFVPVFTMLLPARRATAEFEAERTPARAR